MNPAIDRYLSTIAADLIAEQNRLGIRASGKSAKSLRTDVGDTKGALYGEGYFEQQFYGRGPSRSSQGGILRKQIRDWLDVKSFSSGFDEKKKDGLAYSIAKRIHERGTLRGNTAKYPGIDVQKILNKHKPKLISEVGRALAARFESDIVRGYLSKR